MVLSYRELTAPAAEPVSLQAAKRQLVISGSFTDDDALIESLITAARQHCEKIMQRAIYNRSVVLSLDSFPIPTFGVTLDASDRKAFWTGTYIWEHLAIRLPLPACASITSITYSDQAGTRYTIDPAAYNADLISEPCRVVPKWGCTWPTAAYFTPGSVQVTYVAGTYGDGVDADSCPRAITQAILLLVSYWYNHRDSAETSPPQAIAFSVDALLSPYCFDTFRWNS